MRLAIETTRRTVLGAGLALAAPSIVRAEGTWPNKPITIVVNFPAGGLTDGIARAFGQARGRSVPRRASSPSG